MSLVRSKGLEPPRALAHQDLNLGRFIPSSPVLSQCVLFLGDFWGLELGSSHLAPSCSRVLGCSRGCSEVEPMGCRHPPNLTVTSACSRIGGRQGTVIRLAGVTTV